MGHCRRGRSDPLADVAGRLDVALTWATVDGISDLVLAGHFPLPAHGEDREAAIVETLEAAYRRLAG